VEPALLSCGHACSKNKRGQPDLASQNLSEKFDILIPTVASGNAQPGQGLEGERVTLTHPSCA
ncbi:MAG: hypothetical protein Q7U80_00580, partial [Thiobacillus sp.]|nr:hypothetical protein [Thiobacillus sp.]